MLNKPSAKFITLNPPIWLDLPSLKVKKIVHLTGFDGEFYQLNYLTDGLIGSYKVIRKSGSLFVKIVSLEAYETQKLSEKISLFLKESGLGTVNCVANFPQISDKLGIAVMAYPFIENNYICVSPEAMHLLGVELGKVHQALRQLPYQQEITANSYDYFMSCLNHKSTLYDKLEKMGADTPSLKETIEHFLVANFMSSAQIIHGDMNYGNILVSSYDTQKLTFIDFEESSRSYFNPMLDIAMIIERFIQTKHCRQDDLVDALKDGYINSTGRWFANPQQLTQMLRSLSARALLLLSMEMALKVQTWHGEEFLKFLTLHEKAIVDNEKMMSWSSL